MKIAFATKPQPETDLYLLAVTKEDLKKIRGPHADLIQILIDAFPEFSGDAGDVVTTVLPDYEHARFGLLGLGSAKGRSRLSLEKTGGKLMSALITLPVNDVFVELRGVNANDAAMMGAGAALRAYEFRTYITKKQDQYLSDSVTFASPNPAASRNAFARVDLERDAVHWARDMGNEPPNVLHPVSFADRVSKKLKKAGVKVTVIDDVQLRKMGANALVAVGQASENTARLVLLEYNGTGRKNSSPIGLVGKGVTFDTGGLSIKNTAGMLDMKTDMCGAAAVAGAICSLAARKAKVHVVGALALAENSISDDAFRPSDIITSLSGQTIEVTNTDAEGRLVMADAMWHLQNVHKPRMMVNIATLTGAALVALGEEYAAFFTRDETMRKGLKAASLETGDKIWRMPLDHSYDALAESSVADMRNTPPHSYGASSMAAAFLARFVQDGVKWAHIDMAPTAIARGEHALGPAGVTGFGVRLLARWIENAK